MIRVNLQIAIISLTIAQLLLLQSSLDTSWRLLIYSDWVRVPRHYGLFVRYAVKSCWLILR